MDMEMGVSKADLGTQLAVILSDTVAYKFAAQGYHWNVKGPNFYQFHEFFGELYEDAEGAIDPTAENIRKLGFDAPYSLGDFLSLATYEPRIVTGDPIEMARVLYEMNCNFVNTLTMAFQTANAMNNQGIADFLAGRLDIHQKFCWQLGTICGADSTAIHTID